MRRPARRGTGTRGCLAPTPPQHAGRPPGRPPGAGGRALSLGRPSRRTAPPAPADAVPRVLAVQPRLRPARLVQVGHAPLRPLAELVQGPELDGLGRAGL